MKISKKRSASLRLYNKMSTVVIYSHPDELHTAKPSHTVAGGSLQLRIESLPLALRSLVLHAHWRTFQIIKSGDSETS